MKLIKLGWRVGFLVAVLRVAAGADTIGLLYALEADLSALRTHAEELGAPASPGGRRMDRLRLGPHTVVAVKMGSGCAETAASTEALLGKFHCDRVVSIGPAGALRDDLAVGQWLLVGTVVGWQRGSTGETGFSLNERAALFHLPVDAALLPGPGATNAVLVSGETFVAQAQERSRLRALHNADLIDMNAWGLALVCDRYHAPLTIWRVVSDRADAEAGSSFGAFVARYEGEGGHRLAARLLALPASKDSAAAHPNLRKILDEP